MDLQTLLHAVRQARAETSGTESWCWQPHSRERLDEAGEAAAQPHYSNQDSARGIDFQVERLPFGSLQVMDPRLVRIAPGACNEKHRHAHESIFIVLAGSAQIQIGAASVVVETGQVAYVPRWLIHQTRNRDPERELLLLAITDFGLTSAVLGDYDARTRLRAAGDQAYAELPPS